MQVSSSILHKRSSAFHGLCASTMHRIRRIAGPICLCILTYVSVCWHPFQPPSVRVHSRCFTHSVAHSVYTLSLMALLVNIIAWCQLQPYLYTASAVPQVLYMSILQVSPLHTDCRILSCAKRSAAGLFGVQSGVFTLLRA